MLLALLQRTHGCGLDTPNKIDTIFNRITYASGRITYLKIAVTLKKLCDGLEITLGEFFSTPEFDALEQEIK